MELVFPRALPHFIQLYYLFSSPIAMRYLFDECEYCTMLQVKVWEIFGSLSVEIVERMI